MLYSQLRNIFSNSSTNWYGIIVSLLPFIVPAPALSQIGFPEPTSREQFSDWVNECYTTNQNTFCQAYHRVLMNQGRDIAMVFTITPDLQSKGTYLFQIAVPLGIELSKQAVLSVGADFRVTLPITRCTQQGCLSEGAIRGQAINAMLAGSTAAVTITIPGKGELAIPLSLAGFRDVMSAIEENARENKAQRSPQPATSEDTQENNDLNELRSAPTSNDDENVDPILAPVTKNSHKKN